MNVIGPPLLAGRRRVRRLDGLVIGWVVLWLSLAGWIGFEVWTLQRLSDPLVASARPLDDTSTLLGSLSDLPFVGGKVAQVQQRVEETAASARVSAASTRDNVERLSVLLACAILVLTVSPVAIFYLPARLSWRRDGRAVRRLLATSKDDRSVREYLARRAVQELPYHLLRGVAVDPPADLRAQRYDALAAVELRRLGIEPTDT